MKKYIKADKFYFPYSTKQNGYLEIVDGKFGKWYENVASDSTVLDYSGFQVIPGLVDTHIHGYHGADVMDQSVEGLETMSKGLLETGVTSFLPTTITDSHENYLKVFETIASFSGQETGAKIQGIYLEGPYFTEEFKGAQNPKYMRNPSIEEFQEWQTAAKGMIKKIAIAPERLGVTDYIRQVTETGVVIALGHSNATYSQAVEAVEAGASVWVHAYNGMRGLSHRELGMVGAVYALPKTIAELICDGFHVHPKAAEVLMNQKGSDHVALITDCMRAGGLPDGDYYLGEFPVYVKDGAARLKEGHNLAGSVLKLKDALKNVIEWGIATPEEAVRMATLVPAQSVKIDHKCGQIKEGIAADFLILDQDFNLKETFLDGESAYLKV